MIDRKLRKVSKEVSFSKGAVVLNYSNNRLQIFLLTNPKIKERNHLTQSAFKWSYNNLTWQRILTQNAVDAVNKLFNLEIIYDNE